MANDTHALPQSQLTQVLDWIHFCDSGEEERADDAIVKLTSATGRPICSLNAAWLKALAVASVEGKQSGPGSTEDERKALLQLLDAMPALAPRATGLSHAMRLVLVDALRYRDQQTAAAPAGPPARRAVVDAIAAYVGPTPYAEVLADRMFRLFNSPPAAPGDQALTAAIFGLRVRTDDRVPENEIWMAPTPDYIQRLADAVNAFNALSVRPPSIPPEKARGCATAVRDGEAPRG